MTNIYDGPVAATNQSGLAGIWAEDRTWIYWGQMFLPQGTHYFAENHDDRVTFKINGTTYLYDTGWNTFNVASPAYVVTDPAGEWVNI